MINWLRPAKRSASVSLPLGPSNRYCFSTFSQGSSRRCRLRSSRSLVNSFSLRSNALRRAIHCCGETTSCCLISVLAVRVVTGFLLLAFNFRLNLQLFDFLLSGSSGSVLRFHFVFIRAADLAAYVSSACVRVPAFQPDRLSLRYL